MHIKDDFIAGAPISQVPATWFNRVAKFCNSLVGGDNVTLNKRDDGCASVIEFSLNSDTSNIPTISGADVVADNTIGGTVESALMFNNVNATRPVALRSTWDRGQTGIKVDAVTSIVRYDGVKHGGSGGESVFFAACISTLTFDSMGMLVKVETSKNHYRIQ